MAMTMQRRKLEQYEGHLNEDLPPLDAEEARAKATATALQIQIKHDAQSRVEGARKKLSVTAWAQAANGELDDARSSRISRFSHSDDGAQTSIRPASRWSMAAGNIDLTELK
eukprot:3309749-Prymnesium_polylepis.1